MNPKVSIIIPVYNVEEFLADCLESVLAQSYENWEAICVNDGSKDRSAEILIRYTNKDARIKVITQENQGVSTARNVALSHATGEYICFLDSDDALSPFFIEKMINAMFASNADVAWCDVQSGVHQGEWEKSTCQPREYDDVYEKFLCEELHLIISPWAKMFKVSLFGGKSFDPSLAVAEDLLLLHQLLYDATKGVYVPTSLYWYRENLSSVMHASFSEKVIYGNCLAAARLQSYFLERTLSKRARGLLNKKNAKRIFKFGILEPRRKDKKNLSKWYALTRPLLLELKEKGLYLPHYLPLKHRILSWLFLRKKH